MKRPNLRKVNCDDPANMLLSLVSSGGNMMVTVSRGQWDGIHQCAYDDGWYLVELDSNETPVNIYKKDGE